MITVYGSPTTRAFRILWLLEELEQPYTCRPIDFRAGEHRSDWFLELNPHGKVPVIDIDGVVLFESAAIVTHLCELYPDKGLMPPLGDERRPHFLNGCTLRWQKWMRPCGRLPSTSLPTPRNSVEGADKGAKRDFVKAAEIVMGEMSSKPFLLGDEFSAVDLFITTMVTWAKRIKMDAVPDSLVEWSLKNGERPAFQRAIAQAAKE